MTAKEEDELGRLQAAPIDELVLYVQRLIEEEYHIGYDSGHEDGYHYAFDN